MKMTYVTLVLDDFSKFHVLRSATTDLFFYRTAQVNNALMLSYVSSIISISPSEFRSSIWSIVVYGRE